MSAIEYRVEHKLLFGTDFPFFTARQTIDGLRSVTGTAFGPDMPVVDEQVVEDIIHRPTLELLEIARRGLSVLRGQRRDDLGCAGDLVVADQAVGDEADATRVALQAQDAALGQEPEELVRVELRAADVEEHDVRLDLGRLDLETRDLLEQRPSSRARRWSSASRSTSVSSATSAAAAAIPALWTLAPPSRRSVAVRQLDHLVRPARIAPIGAHRPLFRLTATVFAGAASFDTGIPSATAALKSRAPSRWT